MITRRRSETETHIALVCKNCECIIEQCNICGKLFDDSDYVKCVFLDDVEDDKTYTEILHLCSACKHLKHDIEKGEDE